MRAFFDPVSGVSGDMALGALLDAGLPLADLEAELAKLPVSGYRLDEPSTTEQYGLRGTHVGVTRRPTPHRRTATWPTFAAILRERLAAGGAGAGAGRLPAPWPRPRRGPRHDASRRCISTKWARWTRLWTWWARWPGWPGWGCRRAIAGRCRCRSAAGWGAARTARCPCPARPRCASCAAVQAPVTRPRDTDRELVTPTGAALVATLCRFAQPPCACARVGAGYGTRPCPGPTPCASSWATRLKTGTARLRRTAGREAGMPR